MTQEQTDKIYDAITANDCREMDRERFHQAVNEAIDKHKEGLIHKMKMAGIAAHYDDYGMGYKEGIDKAREILNQK